MVNFKYTDLNRAPQHSTVTSLNKPPQKVPTLNKSAFRVGLGAINLAPSGQPVSPQQGAMQGAAAGAAFGPIGAGVGAAIGVVVGLLSAKPNTAAHIGSWDTQIVQAIGGLPASAAGIGRQIPWNENSHGLVQFIEALLATGVYMAWDTSLKSSYDVCAHWAMTFGAAVQTLVTAIVGNAPGVPVTVSISEQPGANHGPINFSFTNPNLSIGPDAISSQIIMGANGLMYAMIIGLGETAAHAQSNASNAPAQKVFALMVDNIAAQLMPAAAVPTTSVPVVAPAVQAASQTVNASVAAAPPANTASGAPVVAPQDTTALMQSLMAQGATQQQAMLAAMQSLEANGINSQTPQIQQQLQAASSGGMSTTTLLIIAAVGLGAYFLSQQNPRSN